MRRILTWFIVFAMLCTTLFVPVQATNTNAGLTSTLSKTVNSDFEMDASGWQFSGSAKYYATSDKAWTGSASLYVDAEATSSFSQRHAVTEGEMLEFTLHYNAVSYSGKVFMSLTVYSEDNKQLATTSGEKDPTIGTWGQYYLDLVVPEGASYAIASFGINTGGKIYFDTAMLIQYPEEYAWEQIDRQTSNPNIIANPGFEIASGAGPASWNPMDSKGAWGSNKYTLYSTDKANSGTHSVRLYGVGGYYPSISQTVSVEPLATYKFTMNAYFVAGKKCYARLYYYDANGNVIKTQGYPETYKDVNDNRQLNVWTKIVKYFTVEQIPGTTSIKLYINTDGYHDVYVDDISLQKVENAKLCSIETDQWYYYTEWDGGTATVNVTGAAVSAYPGGTVKTYITKKGNNTKLVEKNTAIASTILVPFTTAALSPSYGDEFIVTSEVYNASGNMVGSNTNYFIYYSRPTHLNENGDWIDEDGKPFHVVIGNSATTAEVLQVAKNVGVTVTTIGYTRSAENILKQLDLCQQYGIKAIVNLYSNANPCGRYPSETINAVNVVKDHPAVFAWGVQDEPNEAKSPEAWLRSSYQILRDTDPDHPVYFVESDIGYRESHFKTVDMLCVDAYCSNRGSYATYITPALQELANDAPKHHNKPTAVIIQTFAWRDYFPTENEARHMMYQIPFTGVTYGGYYHMGSGGDTPGISDPAHADFAAAIPPIAKEEMPILYKMFNTDEGTMLAYQNCDLNDGNTSNDKAVWYYVWQGADKTYIAVLNRDPNNTQTASFTLPVKITGTRTEYGNTTGSTVTLQSTETQTAVNMSLAAGAAAIYEYEDANVVYRENFTNNYQNVPFVYNYNGTNYTNSIDLPAGWDYTTDGYYPQHAEKQTNFFRYDSTIYPSCYITRGSWIGLTKMVDVEPGYQYTITTTSAIHRQSKSNRVDTTVLLYHKNDDGSYTPIDEYLTNLNYETKTLANASTYTRVNGNETTTLIKNEYYVADHTATVSIDDPNVNAIMIKLGGSCGMGVDNYAAYRGIKITRDKKLDSIKENKRPVSVIYNLGSDNGGQQQTTVYAQGAGKISLRPVKSAVDSNVSIVSQSGYFKGWQLGGKLYTSEGGAKAPIGDNDATVSLSAVWYDAPNHNIISSAQAQRATLSSGDKAIRFLALVDSSYNTYAKAGFVVTTLATNPTVEAGYKPFTFHNIFHRIRSGENVYGVTDKNFTSSFLIGASMNPRGILYANLVIPEGSERTVYYATPYVETLDGTRIYGKTKAVTYKELLDLDNGVLTLMTDEDEGQQNVVRNLGANIVKEQ